MTAAAHLAPPAKGAPARFDRGSQHRRAMLAKIHVAKKELAMDDDDYRQILFEESGKRSAADLNDVQLGRVLERFKGIGFKPKLGSKRAPAAQHPVARKARAMWISLYYLAVVKNSSEEALEAFAKNQLGCERLKWARQSHGYKLIEALKAMAVRYDWPQHDKRTGKPLDVLSLQRGLCDAIVERLKKRGEIPIDATLAETAFRLCGVEDAGDLLWSAEQYAELAEKLGRKLRATFRAEQ